MRKRVGRVGYRIFMLLCMGACFGCTSDQRTADSRKEQETVQSTSSEEDPVQESDGQEETEEYSLAVQLRENEEKLYEEADRQGIGRQEAETCLQVLMDDDIFQDGVMELTGLRIGDIDGNGQIDMLVVVQDVQEKFLYGTGGLWFYMNEDEPYCFWEEECPYFGWHSSYWGDLDNDGHTEITFCAQGTGNEGAGDHYKAVFKYKNHSIEQMQLPSDYDQDFEGEYCEYGLDVSVFQESEADIYRAYCTCLDEWISFHMKNKKGVDLPDAARCVGGNVGGFYDLCVVEYEGRSVLQASEYLRVAVGVTNVDAVAQFLITWEADGTPKVIKWWIEECGCSTSSIFVLLPRSES